MDWPGLVIAIGWLCVGLAGGFWIGYRRGYSQKPEPSGPPLSTALLEELTDLRYLKKEIETPPQPHEHIWPREPDMRIPNWLRYRCIVKGCTQFKWDPVGPRHKTVEPTSAIYNPEKAE